MFMNLFSFYVDVITSEKTVMYLAVSTLLNLKEKQQQKNTRTLCLHEPESMRENEVAPAMISHRLLN